MQNLPERMAPLASGHRPLDPSLRRRIHGPIQPMQQPGLLEKALRFLRAL